MGWGLERASGLLACSLYRPRGSHSFCALAIICSLWSSLVLLINSVMLRGSSVIGHCVEA